MGVQVGVILQIGYQQFIPLLFKCPWMASRKILGGYPLFINHSFNSLSEHFLLRRRYCPLGIFLSRDLGWHLFRLRRLLVAVLLRKTFALNMWSSTSKNSKIFLLTSCMKCKPTRLLFNFWTNPLKDCNMRLCDMCLCNKTVICDMCLFIRLVFVFGVFIQLFE